MAVSFSFSFCFETEGNLEPAPSRSSVMWGNWERESMSQRGDVCFFHHSIFDTLEAMPHPAEGCQGQRLSQSHSSGHCRWGHIGHWFMLGPLKVIPFDSFSPNIWKVYNLGWFVFLQPFLHTCFANLFSRKPLNSTILTTSYASSYVDSNNKIFQNVINVFTFTHHLVFVLLLQVVKVCNISPYRAVPAIGLESYLFLNAFVINTLGQLVLKAAPYW